MNHTLEQRLTHFRDSNGIGRSKGKLSVVLHVTRVANDKGLPLDATTLRTPGKGQVLGLSRSAIQTILNDYGIQRILAQEGGRTSRGSLGLMENYVAFLNTLEIEGVADLKAIEQWWIDQVFDFFASEPFKLRYDVSRSLRAIIQELFEQAGQRQHENPGTTYLGTVVQHLVGAKLELVLRNRNIKVQHHSASTADTPTARQGDFILDKIAIHVTTAPTTNLMVRCKENLEAGYRPIVVTLHDRVPAAEGNAQIEGIEDRVDILAVEQFLATNLHELSGFRDSERHSSIAELVAEYNKIIDNHETDPSLHIQISS